MPVAVESCSARHVLPKGPSQQRRPENPPRVPGGLMPKLLTQGVSLEPKNGRQLIGIVAGFKSERWPVIDRNAGRLQLGIRKVSLIDVAYDPAQPVLGNPNGDLSIVEFFDYA